MINGEICEKRWMYSQHLLHNIRHTLVINIFLLMTYVHVPISFPFTLFSTRRCYYFRGYDIRTKRYMRTFLKVIKTPSTTTYIKKQRKLWSWKIMTPCRLTNAPFLHGKNPESSFFILVRCTYMNSEYFSSKSYPSGKGMPICSKIPLYCSGSRRRSYGSWDSLSCELQ